MYWDLNYAGPFYTSPMKLQRVSNKPSMEEKDPRRGAEGINYQSAFSFSFTQATGAQGSSFTPPSIWVKTTKHSPEPKIETVSGHTHSLLLESIL